MVLTTGLSIVLKYTPSSIKPKLIASSDAVMSKLNNSDASHTSKVLIMKSIDVITYSIISVNIVVKISYWLLPAEEKK